MLLFICYFFYLLQSAGYKNNMNLSQHVANVGPLADAVDASGEASILVESLLDAASLPTLDSTMLSSV